MKIDSPGYLLPVHTLILFSHLILTNIPFLDFMKMLPQDNMGKYEGNTWEVLKNTAINAGGLTQKAYG